MQTVLITGANRGIGLGLAEEAVKRGHRVVATVRDPFHVPDFLKTAPREQMILIGMDVADDRSVARAAASIKEPLDGLINNAGLHGVRGSQTGSIDLGEMRQVFEINTLAPLRVLQAFLPHLEKAQAARVLTVSSQMGALSGSAKGSLAYRASKAAVNKLMQGVALDLKPKGISVAVVHPGWVKTDMGGPDADLTVAESASGLIDLFERLTLDESGGFFRWDGSVHPW